MYIDSVINVLPTMYVKKEIHNVTVNKGVLYNNKDKPAVEEKSGVYQINCSDWKAIYIGEGGVKEHKQPITDKHLFSDFVAYCIDNYHQFDVSM